MREARFIGDRAVLLTCLMAGMFLLGLWAGQGKKELICPEYQGAKLAHVTSKGTEVTCTYVTSIKGLVKASIRL